MKKLFLLMLSLGIIACTTSRDNFINPYPKIETIQDLPKEYLFRPKYCSSHFPKNGSFDEIASNGRRIKAKTKNHCIDEEVFIYHPNGQLHSNTPLVDGLADGWSNGYTENGILRTKILYQKGYTILIQVYNNDGQIVKEIK